VLDTIRDTSFALSNDYSMSRAFRRDDNLARDGVRHEKGSLLFACFNDESVLVVGAVVVAAVAQAREVEKGQRQDEEHHEAQFATLGPVEVFAKPPHGCAFMPTIALLLLYCCC
jgi:hypothetical protein